MTDTKTGYVPAKEYATLIGVDRQTVVGWIKNKRVPGARIVSSWFVARSFYEKTRSELLE